MKGCVFLKRISIVLAIIIILFCININDKSEVIIPTDSIRIRIIANSNNIEDQVLKLKIKKQVEENLNNKLQNINNVSSARINIKNNISEIEKIIKNNISNDDYEIKYGINYFPEKELYGVTYKEGNYESLVIKLGEAKGNNWWCVLFPPLCMIDSKIEENGNNVEYKSKVLVILNKYQ